jgi:hypothetical protein
MKKFILSLFVLSLVGTAAHPQTVSTILTKELPEAPGKEIQVITVNYPPGAVNAIHRHGAHVVVYILEGEVEMQGRGGTLQPLGFEPITKLSGHKTAHTTVSSDSGNSTTNTARSTE